ncbi:MAG: carboxyvinyl-carboxyphosphonate phosphorylmutase [Hyphomicrobiales bacterium]|nr:carboxyvinyl-carboxyphosphonate phosphorylmutase [Hyphomicrobiales bacterium]
MTHSPRTEDLRARLSRKEIVLAPGVFDPLTASIAADAGFEALYLSGAAIAYTKLGRPDIGLVTMSEVADTLAHIRERVETPLIVDADTGYGNALNVERTMRVFERAGASAIQLEDQSLPKRCGHLADKTLVSAQEMVGKIKAALDARASERTLVIARTDAVAVEGFEAAADRAALYVEAGADVLFVEAPQDSAQLARVGALQGGRTPLMANMVEGGRTPVLSASALQDMGFSLVIFPGGIVRALARAAQDFYGTLARDGQSNGFANRMFDFDGLNALLGTSDILARGKRYEGGGR